MSKTRHNLSQAKNNHQHRNGNDAGWGGAGHNSSIARWGNNKDLAYLTYQRMLQIQLVLYGRIRYRAPTDLRVYFWHVHPVMAGPTEGQQPRKIGISQAPTESRNLSIKGIV
jgi:hypothetical protein